MLYAIYERCRTSARKARKSMILATEQTDPAEISRDARMLWRAVTGEEPHELHVRAMGALDCHMRAEVEYSTGC